ncbi:hypothetical protein [Streptomyces endophyticus]|uniref:Uncharacterized protein n=1 Tax=Streptomyces endophyticus TaxID=714166 RepID=A0ABU6FJ87_9ACTN|nr:hypothetical protein [Streptomyces endophyticus]MEB8344110.1 hypothetical protein [Streptomyces endophyticus]
MSFHKIAPISKNRKPAAPAAPAKRHAQPKKGAPKQHAKRRPVGGKR